MNHPIDTTQWTTRLEHLGLAVRQRILSTRTGHHSTGNPPPSAPELAQAVEQIGGDVIFGIDRYVEPIIQQQIQSWSQDCKPLLLIAEGMGTDGQVRYGPPDLPLRYRLLIDPIDGTRNLMYDKRPAWFIAAVAPDHGHATSLSHSLASVLVELPVSKQGWADCFTAVRGQPLHAVRTNLDTNESQPLVVTPSTATDLFHGFAQVTNFFPGTKVLGSQLSERIVEQVQGPINPGVPCVFDDQYMSTAGQMVELMLGHDRFCADLRPLLFAALHRQTGHPVTKDALPCHPYDIAGLLVAQQAGVIFTDGFGQPLDAPMDVHHPVHWCAYANQTLQNKIEPVIKDWLTQHAVTPDDR